MDIQNFFAKKIYRKIHKILLNFFTTNKFPDRVVLNGWKKVVPRCFTGQNKSLPRCFTGRKRLWPSCFSNQKKSWPRIPITGFIRVRENLENLEKGSFFGKVREKVRGNLKNGKSQGKSGKILCFSLNYYNLGIWRVHEPCIRDLFAKWGLDSHPSSIYEKVSDCNWNDFEM